MSYDIHFKAKLEGCDKYVPIYIEHDNYTYNLSKAWRAASGLEDFNLQDLDGANAEKGLPIIKKIIDELTNNPEKYRDYEPSNGYGNIETSVGFLKGIANTWEEYPTAILEVR